MSDALDLFFHDCGAAPPLTLQVEQQHRSRPRRVDLQQPFALLGRTEGNDVCLPDPQVSRRHAYVQLFGGTAFCLDIGDRSGLRWEGQAARSGWLEPGRPVQIGPFRVGCAQLGPTHPAPCSPLAPGSLDPASPAGWLLEATGEDGRAFQWKVDRVLTLLGSSPHCKLQLPGGKVSRFHALFFCAPARLWVIDLLSREGTYVDGERVRWRGVEDGSEIRVGRLSLRAGKEIRAVPAPPEERSSRQLQTVPSLLPSGPPMLVPTALPGFPAELRPEVVGAQGALLAPFFQQMNLMQQQMFEQMQQMVLFMAQTFSSLHQEQTASLRKELDELKRVTGELQTLQSELAREQDSSAPAAPSPPPPAPATPAPETRPSPPPGAPRVPVVPAQAGEVVHAQLFQRIAELEQERKSRWQKILGLMKG